MRRRKIQLFGKKSVLQENKECKRAATDEIQEESADRILSADKGEYIDYIVGKYGYEKVNFALDSISWDVDSFSKDANLSIFVPAKGSTEILELKPQHSRVKSFSPTINRSTAGDGDEFELEFDVGNPGRHRSWTEDRIESKIEEIKDYIKSDWSSLESDIESFDQELKSVAERAFDNRFEEARKHREMFENVEYPLRKRTETPDSISIDSPSRREKIEKPDPDTDIATEPVPVVPEETYRQVLDTINDVGTGFERSPGIFQEFGEEDLRDIIRVFLEMNFEGGTATGETFNKEGKTDILLKSSDGDNVFLAECAIWGGKERLKDKVDQLFRYLTWKDSKAAVVMFVNNKQFGPVEEQISQAASEHGCVEDLENREAESWWQYSAHFPDEPDRELDLAIFAFHIPPV